MTGLLARDSTGQLDDHVRRLREDRASRTNTEAGSSFENEFVTQSVMLDMVIDNFLKPLDGYKGLAYIGDPVSSACLVDLFLYMNETDFFQGIPPWYSDLVAPIFTHTRQGDLTQAIAAARKALQVAERDGHVLVASKFRQICRKLGEFDVSNDYDAHQAMLSRLAETSSIFLSEVLGYLAKHDTPAAYQHAKQAYDESQLSKAFLPLLRLLGDDLPPLFASIFDNLPQLEVGFNGLGRLVELLEPYKEASLEDKREWVELVWKIRKLVTDLNNQSRPLDMEWAYKARDVFNDQNQLANEMGVDVEVVRKSQDIWSNVFKAAAEDTSEKVTEVDDQAAEMTEEGVADQD